MLENNNNEKKKKKKDIRYFALYKFRLDGEFYRDK